MSDQNLKPFYLPMVCPGVVVPKAWSPILTKVTKIDQRNSKNGDVITSRAKSKRSQVGKKKGYKKNKKASQALMQRM